MRRCIALCILAFAATPLCAQHHGGSPPTAPPRPAPPPVAVSSGLGPIQFAPVNYGVPAPQSLTRQLRSDDERTRAAALSALGVPAQYLQRGRVQAPRTIQLFFGQLGPDDDVDAILTVELDQHIVSAVLIPDGDNWRRIATFYVADPFNDPNNTASTFVRTDRSLLARGHYRAIFRATALGAHGSSVENEAQLKVINGHAIITISFVSAARDCNSPPATSGKPPLATTGCNILSRWLQADASDPLKHFTLVSATGHISAREMTPLFSTDPAFIASHLHGFSCQPFTFSDQSQRFEPTANSGSCPAK